MTRSALLRTLLAAFCLLAGLAHSQVVINELHYDPSNPTQEIEFIELFNPSPNPIDLSGWRLEDGVEFVFPQGTSLPQNGYLVIAQNPAVFQARFGFAPLGPWTGKLANDGERVQLRRTNAELVDEVSYGAGFPWPTAARGGGQSMELIHPALDNNLGGSWRSSQTTPDSILVARGSSGWHYRPGTTEASNPTSLWRSESFVEDGTWTASGSTPIGYGDIDGNTGNVDVATTINGMSGVYRSLFLRRTFTLSAGSIPNTLVLRIRCDDGCIVWINGAEIDPRVRVSNNAPVFDASGMTITNVTEPPLAWEPDIIIPNAQSFLHEGTNVIAIQVFNTSLTSSDLFLDAELALPGATDGSPGIQNTVYNTLVPPQIRQVDHSPSQPASNTAVVVTAKVTDPDGIGTVTLSYQLVNPGSYIRKTDPSYSTSWTDLPMNDAGTDGDATAGDNVFSATIPSVIQTHRRLVRYRITAKDSGNNSVTVPYPDDEQPNFAYFVYDGVPSWSGAVQIGSAAPRGTVQTYPGSLLSSIQTWQLIANSSDVDNCQYNSSFDGSHFLGTLVYDGKVYDHIQFRNRGIGSTYVSGKNKWALYFNRARDIRVRDNWGNYYKESWNSFPIDACASPWAAVHRGMAGVEEAVTYRIYELGGMASLRTHYMHWRVIRSASESGPTQYEGDFWGLYLGLEPTEGNFLDERGLPDGNLYSIEGGGGDKKHQGATQVTNGSDWTTFRDSANAGGQSEQWYRSNLDLPVLYTFLALNRFCGNVDVRGGDNFRFYHRPTDDRWMIIPYDLDMMAMPAHHWGTNVDGLTFAGVPDQIRAITRHPALALEFRNRARELLDLFGSDNSPAGGQIGQLIDEYSQMVNPTGASPTWVNADEALWCNHPRTTGGGANSGQTSHRNNFYRAQYFDTRGGLNGTPTTSWTRTYPDPDGNGYATFEDTMGYLLKFMTNTWPGGTWLRSNGNPLGYGWKYLEWESLYGGFGNVNAQPATPDLAFPNTPSISYSCPEDYPANALDFTSTAFTPSPSGGSTFAAIQWRIGQLDAPGIPGYVPGSRRTYEAEEVWTSPELTSFTATMRVPLRDVHPGSTYRARVRHKDANGRWSHWSAPVQFVPTAPDVTVYQQALAITEVNYFPGPLSSAEFAAGFTTNDFEWIELKNIGAQALDCTGLRFTKGVDFDFPDNYMIPPNGFALVVKDIAAFQFRYGNAFNSIIAGSYPNDNLANAGEELKLSYGGGTPVIDFTYSSASPWPTAPAGTGKTLVLHDPTSHPDPALPQNWRASYNTGGSPGADDNLGYDAWVLAYPGADDPADDTDLDGVTNLLEYALLSNPLISGTDHLPVPGKQLFVVSGTPGTYLTLTYTRWSSAPDINYHVEFADSPGGPWLENGTKVTSTDNSDGSLTESWRSATPISQTGHQFARLRVVK